MLPEVAGDGGKSSHAQARSCLAHTDLIHLLLRLVHPSTLTANSVAVHIPQRHQYSLPLLFWALLGVMQRRLSSIRAGPLPSGTLYFIQFPQCSDHIIAIGQLKATQSSTMIRSVSRYHRSTASSTYPFVPRRDREENMHVGACILCRKLAPSHWPPAPTARLPGPRSIGVTAKPPSAWSSKDAPSTCAR